MGIMLYIIWAKGIDLHGIYSFTWDFGQVTNLVFVEMEVRVEDFDFVV